MNRKSDKVIFRVDEKAQDAFQELKDRYFLNISAFLRQCLIDKHKELKEKDATNKIQ